MLNLAAPRGPNESSYRWVLLARGGPPAPSPASLPCPPPPPTLSPTCCPTRACGRRHADSIRSSTMHSHRRPPPPHAPPPPAPGGLSNSRGPLRTMRARLRREGTRPPIQMRHAREGTRRGPRVASGRVHRGRGGDRHQRALRRRPGGNGDGGVVESRRGPRHVRDGAGKAQTGAAPTKKWPRGGGLKRVRNLLHRVPTSKAQGQLSTLLRGSRPNVYPRKSPLK